MTKVSLTSKISLNSQKKKINMMVFYSRTTLNSVKFVTFTMTGHQEEQSFTIKITHSLSRSTTWITWKFVTPRTTKTF
jgi:hypothetical protein